ncbi:MAG TPA: contractile injection system tape measure protein, partial [Haliangium sp.]|nr:contractile injection system tape measure protein [Haliangium sp.]
MATHLINRAEIELEVGEVALAEHLLERVSLLRERRIAPLLDRVCSELSGPGPGPAVRIDQLELELGSIALDDFEDDFIRKLEAALRAALSKVLSEQRGAALAERASIELLEIFARTGNLPWWADRSEPTLVASHVRVLLARAPHALIRLLHALADDAPALARIARHCDDALLDEIVVQMHAGAGAELRADIHALERLLAGGESGPGRSSVIRARGAVLAALARIGRREPQRTLDALLDEIARSSPLSWDALARGELPATPRLRDAVSRARTSVATAPREHATGRDRTQVDSHASAAQVASLALERDAIDVRPVERAAPFTDDRPSMPEHMVEHGPPHEHGGPDARARLDGDTSSEAIPIGDASLQDQLSEDGSPAPTLPAPTPALPAPAVAAPGPDVPVPAEAAIAATTPGVAAPRDPRAIAAARRRALDQLEQLYVDDAGLVILWPFLDRFFLHAGLLDQDRRFAGEQAPMQAIALLSQLASEDPEPPEFRLPLAKLLCGLPPEAGFALERPLAPEQLDECERLLAAVIGHASILRDMPVASFRATFLQRTGVLSVRDGAWLLQVERQSHDLVLDRFPWSWSWVRLPWMPDPLRVEW